MESITPDMLAQLGRLSGMTFTDAEIAALQPLVQRTLEVLERLESLPLTGVEPAVQFRMI